MRNIITRLSSFFSVAAVVMMVMCGSVKAQIIEIGTGTSTTARPMPGLWGWQYDVYLYTPSDAVELNSALTITGIGYNISSNSTTTGAQLTIWMKDVDASYTLNANTTFANYTSGATQVYRNTALSTTEGWNTFNFSSDFQHTAGKAILVAVLGKGCTTSGGCSRYCYYTSVSNRHWSKYADSNDPGTSVSGSLDANLVNIRLIRYCTPRTGTFEFRNGSTPVTTTINHLIGNTFTAPTLVNNLTPSGTPTYTSSNTAIATVNATTGAVTFTGQEGFVTITATVAVSGTYCDKSTSYTINVNNGCVKVGTGTSTTYQTPLNNLYNYSFTEMFYMSDEIGYPNGGTIDRIGFQYAYSSAMTDKNNVKIYMANTTRSSFASGAVSELIITGLQLVYSGPLNCAGNGTWNYFDLDEEFDYDGGNLVVAVDDNSGDYNGSAYVFNATTTTGNTVWRYQSDGTYYGANTISGYTGTGSYGTSRVNTAFCISEACTHRTGTFAFEGYNGSTVYTYVVGSGDFVEPNLVANLTPGNGTITYESNNTAIATVDANGNVTFTGAEGLVVITAVSEMAGYCKERARYSIEVGDGCRKIGNGTSTMSSAPLYGLYKNSYDQMIYTASEIGMAGMISAIGFNASSANNTVRSIDIYIGEITQSTFSSSTNFIAANNLTRVYSNQAWHVESGWNMFQLDVPYQYSGVNNLVVAVDCGATSCSSAYFYYTSTGGTTVIYAYSDTYDAIPATIGSYQGSTSSTSNRPNIKLCIEACSIQPDGFGFSNSIAMCYLGGQPNITLNRGGNNATAVWTSSDPTVATVDENGVITTHSLGTTTISVSVPIDGEICSAHSSYELQVICPAHIPSTQAVSICDAQAVDLTATVRDDEGNLELQWFDDVLSDTPVFTGDTYHTNVSATTTYYVAAYNTEQHCYSSRVPATVHVFDVQYDATTTNVSGYVGVVMYGFPPEGSHEGATFTATGMPGWLTLNSDGSFSGTPTAAGSGSFTITATNAMGCSITRTINWTVSNNNLPCCALESFYIYQDNHAFPLQLEDDGYYYANVCLNTPMTLRVQKLNTCSGTYSYTWRLASSTGGLIQEFTGTQMTYTYDRAAGYGVTLQVRRNNSDCVSIPIRVRVAGVFQVATRPSFNLCHGEPFNIYVSTDGVGAIDVVRPTGGAGTTLSVPNTVFLPDGVDCGDGCSYTSSVNFTDFAVGAHIRNANDILYLRINLEHSYIGDIAILLSCPNNYRTVSIMNYGGSGSSNCLSSIASEYRGWTGTNTVPYCQFGDANDCTEMNGGDGSDDCDPTQNLPGIGWNYIWSQNTSRGYVYAASDNSKVYESANQNSTTTCETSVDSSDITNMTQIYRPDGNFADFTGCDLNGEWSLTIIDGYNVDNGYVFEWELGLSEDLLPDSWSYTVDLDSAWVTCGWNSTKSGVYMEITPPDNFNGTESCDLFLRDEYGCTSTYEDIVTVTMNPTVHSTEEVSGQCEPYTWARNNQTYTTSGTYVDAGLTPQGCPDTATLVLTVSGVVYDTVDEQACNSFTWSVNGQTYTSSTQVSETLTSAMGCDSIMTLNLDILPVLTTEKDTTICPDNFPLTWYGVTFNAAGDNVRTLQTADGCDSTVTLHVYAYSKPNLTLPTPDGAGGCPRMSGNYVITPNITNAQTPYIYEWHGNENAYTGNASTATIPANGTCTVYRDTLYLTDANGCKDTATVEFSTIDGAVPTFTTTFTEVDAELVGYDCRYVVPDIIALLQPTDNCGIAEMIQTPLPSNDIDDNTDVHITIEDHCGNRTTADVVVKVPQPLQGELDHTNVACNGGNNANVWFSTPVTGGTQPYTYSWTSTGEGATNVSGQTGSSLTGVGAGTYTVTVTDAAECTIVRSVIVTQAGSLTATIDYTQPNCHGEDNGSVTLTSVSQGTYGTGYLYTWSRTVNGVTTQLTNNSRDSLLTSGVIAGTYTVLITDAEGCTLTKTIVVDEPSQVQVSINNHTNVTCWHFNDGTATALASGGDNSFTNASYTWTSSALATPRTGASVTGLPAGTYTVTVEDGHHCQATDQVTITEFDTLIAIAGTTANPICNGQSVTISVAAFGGNQTQYSYHWNNNSNQASQNVQPANTTTYHVTVTDANGCTAEDDITVNVNQSTSGVDPHTACDSYTWDKNGQTYTTSTNTPSVTLTNAAGCDSTVYLNLTINHSNSAVFEATACETYEWHGQTYTQTTNTPTYTTTNAAGCDSTTTLHLTVYHNNYQVHYATACDTYTWTIRGHSYTRTNSDVIVDTYTIGTCSGADTLHLTINHSSSGIDEEVACNTYTWYRNGQVYTNSTSTPSITLPNGNSFGCDSTIVLHLTINRSTTGIDAHTACDSYTWPMNSMTYTNSTTTPSVYAGLNTAGCDSTVYLHLTINRSTSSVFNMTACDSYTWPMNGQTYTYSIATPQVTVQNHAGCDSTITLHLTINNTRYGSVVDTVCSGERLNYRGQYYPAGNHTVTITATNGCDSIVALQVIPRMPLTVSIEEYHTCELGHYMVTGNINADVNHRWSSQPSDPDLYNQRYDLEIEVNPPQTTDYTLSAGYGNAMLCQVTATIRLEPLRLPIAGIAFQRPYLTCDDLDWTAFSTSQNAPEVTWYVDDIQVSNETTISGRALCKDDSIRFSLMAVNGICSDVIDTVLYVRKSSLWFPNVFTPNLNINKTFNAIGNGIIEYEIYIYTREGLLVFHSTSLEDSWRGDHNGIECPKGTYTYIARYRNEIEPDVWHKQIGTVTMLR